MQLKGFVYLQIGEFQVDLVYLVVNVADHPKMLAAGAEASWLWICGLTYCARQEKSKGFIPASKVPLLFPLQSPLELAAILVKVGLWEEVKDGFQIHDYLEYRFDDPRRSSLFPPQTPPNTQNTISDLSKRSDLSYLSLNSDLRSGSDLTKSFSPGASAPAYRQEETKVKTNGRKSTAPTFLPEDWKPDEKTVKFTEDHEVDPVKMLERFRAYYESVAENKAKMRNWNAAFRNFVLKAIDFGNAPKLNRNARPLNYKPVQFFPRLLAATGGTDSSAEVASGDASETTLTSTGLDGLKSIVEPTNGQQIEMFSEEQKLATLRAQVADMIPTRYARDLKETDED